MALLDMDEFEFGVVMLFIFVMTMFIFYMMTENAKYRAGYKKTDTSSQIVTNN